MGACGTELRGVRTAEGRDIAASALDPERWQSAGVVLTTCKTMRDYHLSFARTPFAVIVRDEVQKLKNPASQMTRAAKTLNARFQLAMTGTPVENRLQDLWSIYHVIHLSRWWNPAVEDRATDRAFRIGQTKDVHVCLPQAVHPDPSVGPSSFDLKLDALMTRKREFSRGLLIPGESGSDIDQLLDDVLAEGGAAEAAADVAPEPEPPIAAASMAPHPTLTVASPAPAPSPAANVPRRAAFVRGGRRDYAIFTAALAGRHVGELVLRDPYACARPENRELLVEFVALPGATAAAIGEVTITAWDADSANQPPIESDRAQRAQLDACWRAKLARPELPRFIALSRRSTRGFHDRAVIAHLADCGRIGWDVSNGIDGVMLTSKECVINRWREWWTEISNSAAAGQRSERRPVPHAIC